MGGGGLYPLGLGEGIHVYDMIKERYPQKRVSFSGISSGSWVALLLALDLSFVEIKQYFTEFAALFNAFYKTRITYWFINLEILLRKILTQNGGYKKLDNKLFVGMTSWSSQQKRFIFQIANQFESDEDVIDAILASSHVFVMGRRWYRYYKGDISFDGNFMRFNVILHDKKYINLLIEYKLTFYNKSPLDSMISYSLGKFNRLYREGVRKYEQNKLKYMEQIESNQTLPCSYYEGMLSPYFKQKKKRKATFLVLLIMAFFQFLGILC
eukprot:128117_1